MLPTNKNKDFSLIGAGNIAWFLGLKLVSAGWTCKAVYSRNKTTANELARALKTIVIESLADLTDNTASCCIIAVPDHAIAAIASELGLKETIVLHTAGSVSIAALPFANKGVLWPIYSISKQEHILHRAIPIVIEATNKKTEKIIKSIAQTVSDNVAIATWQQRQWLHLSAVVGNNFTNHLMAICMQICAEQNLDFQLLQPILQQTYRRAIYTNPTQTQTGPARRGDQITIEKHIDLLQQHPLWQQLYKNISTSIEDMYRKDRE